MRIVQVINSVGLKRGGAERLCHDLHLDLLASGVDAHLVALEQSETADLPNAVSLGFASPYDPRALIQLARWFKAFGPSDLVHAHLFPTSAHIALLRSLKIIKSPIVFTEHSTSNRRRQGMLGKIIDPRIYDRFDRIYAISEGAKDALIDDYPALKDKVTTIRNGARLRYDACPVRASGETVRILSVGRLTPAKNYDTILRAMRGIENARYDILGDGTLRPALEKQIATEGLTGYVSLEGHRTDITPHLERSDIFVAMSKWEGFGLATVEAMNAGLPVVASDIPGLREVVGPDGECGFLISPDDPDAIRDAVQKLIDDPQLRRRMGANAFERSHLFDKTAMADAYRTAYQNLAGI